MERMTDRDCTGELWYIGGTGADHLHRLAAYEDTGLTPEECRELLVTHRVELCESADYDCVELGKYRRAEAEGRLLVLNTAPQEQYDGLIRKYIVFKSDTGEPVENCFVLRPDKDYAARCALAAYAQNTDNGILADDIERWIEALESEDALAKEG